MISNNNKKVKNIVSLIFLVTSISACTYSPGLRVSEQLDPIDDSTSYKKSDYNPKIPKYFTTKSGVKVKFDQLAAHNLPVKKRVSLNTIRNVEYLLKSSLTESRDYRIAKGDTLSINLWAYPEIFGVQTTTSANTAYRVSQSGNITLPLIGRVKALGKTTEYLTDEINYYYSKYLKHPDIVIKVQEYRGRSYSVLGKVKKAGEFKIDDKPATLMSAIGNAGGLLPDANSYDLVLKRNGKSYTFGLPQLQKLDVSLNRISIKDGDELIVRSNENRKVYVIGEIQTPSSLTIPEKGMSLGQAIGESKGLNTLSSNPAKIYVLRNDKNKNYTQIYRLDLSNIENYGLANKFEMLPSDTVYVDATGLSRWNRVLTQLLTTGTAIRTSQTIGNF